MKEWLNRYIADHRKALGSLPLDAIHALILKLARVNKERKRIFVFGNGGSAATASHFVNDMAKSASEKVPDRFKCISLNENMSLITAISNDYSYQDIFRLQMENLAEKGDIVLTMSVSGNSPNLVEAITWANDHGLHTIALTGGNKGKLAELAHDVIVVDSLHYGHVEDIHMMICHMIAYAFVENPDIISSQ